MFYLFYDLFLYIFILVYFNLELKNRIKINTSNFTIATILI